MRPRVAKRRPSPARWSRHLSRYAKAWQFPSETKHYNKRWYLHIGEDNSSWLYEFARYIPATVPPTEQHEADVRELEERHAA